MKNTLLAFIALPLMIACSPSKENKMDYSQINFSMDTVLVDSKEEILYLKTSLSSADLSENKKYLYNFNNDTHTLEIIDLDNFVFIDRISYEKEGPDGVGNFVQSIFTIDGERLLINSFMQSGEFDLEGKKIEDFNLKNLTGDALNRGEMLNHQMVHPKFPNQLVGLYNDFSFQSVHIGKINSIQNSVKKIPLENFGYLKDFFTQWIGESGFPEAFMGPVLYRTTYHDKVVFSHSVASEMYIYEFGADSTYFSNIKLNSIPERKIGKYPRDVNSKAEFFNTLKDYGSEISFQKPIWDSEKEVFYRFANINIYKEIDGEWKTEEADVYLIILDKNFNVLAETEVEGYRKIPRYHFVKDGKIWIFENMDDEMAFVRLSIMP
jgi:hypothetical protein